MIQIRDGEASAQEVWLAFLRKYAYYGVGMKANVWEFAGVGRFFLFLDSHLCWMAPLLLGNWIEANAETQRSERIWMPKWSK